MANTIAPIPLNPATAGASSSSQRNGTNLSSEDFMKILLTEMANPNIAQLLSSDNNSNSSSNSSLFGSTTGLSSLLGSGSNTSLASQILTGNSAASGVLPSAQAGLPMLSFLIGKEIKSVDNLTKAETSGTVQRVLMQDGVAMVDIGSSIIDPSTITEVK